MHYIFNHKTAGDDVLLLYVVENIDPNSFMGESLFQEKKVRFTAEDYHKLVATDLKQNIAVPKENVENKETDEEKGQNDKGNDKQEEVKEKCDFVTIVAYCQKCGML